MSGGWWTDPIFTLFGFMASLALNSTSAQELSTLAEHISISRYLILVGFIVLIYDHFLTLPEEIEYVWKRSKKNFISVIFLLNRYIIPFVLAIDVYDKLGLAHNLNTTFCQVWVVMEVVIHLLSHAAIHGLVAIRANALWGNRPWIRWSLLTSWMIYVCFAMAIGLAAVVKNKDTFHADPFFHSCLGGVGKFVFWVWVPPLILEVMVFGLTVVRASTQSKRIITTMPIAYVLYRDGFTYFLVISLCSVFNLIVWRWLPADFFALAKYFTLGMVSTMGARLVLNLRSLGGVRVNGTPPTIYFIDAIPPGTYDETEARPCVSDPNWGGGPRPRYHLPYGETAVIKPRRLELDFPRHPPPKRVKTDPYFYNRQASRLRALRIERPDLSIRAPSPSAPPPAHIPVVSEYTTPSELEEAVARSRITPRPSISRRSSVSTRDLGSIKGEVYNLQTWSVVMGSQSSLPRHENSLPPAQSPRARSATPLPGDHSQDHDSQNTRWTYI